MKGSSKETTPPGLLGDDACWTYTLTDAKGNLDVESFSVSNEELGVPTRFRVSKETLHGGKQTGSALIRIVTDHLTLVIVPTRGMSILEAFAGNVRLGWDSPVDEVVHPAFINLEARGGLGWLDGFNEFLVRCGAEWAGHPCEENGRRFTLHGRMGNIPASKVIVQIGKTAPHTIRVFGLIKEKTFKFSNLETWTAATVVPGEKKFSLHDRIHNCADYPKEIQYFYHTNYGAPLLEAGAEFVAPVAEVSPFNDYAKAELDTWTTYRPATADYDERCFNCTLNTDAQGKSLVALVNKERTVAASMYFPTDVFPFFTLWKNTDTIGQGYVTGLEPGTNPPYNRRIEKEQGRLRVLAPKSHFDYSVEIAVVDNAADVKKLKDAIAAIQNGRQEKRSQTPLGNE